jgi:hypothetical protein
VRDVNPEQYWNALVPMVLTEFGIVRAPVSPVQAWNAELPICIIVLGITILTKAVQLTNAEAPILVTVFPAAEATVPMSRFGSMSALLAPPAGPVITPLVTVKLTVVPLLPKLSVKLLIIYI